MEFKATLARHVCQLLSPLLHSQKHVSTHLNKFQLGLQFITKQNYFFLIGKVTFGTHCTLDHLANLEHVQNTFLMHKHLVTVFFGLEKAYDMAWQFGILRTLQGWIVGGQLPLQIFYRILTSVFILAMSALHALSKKMEYCKV
jgi:hypothetical protein